MKKISKRKLEISKLTVRRLDAHDLVHVQGGAIDGDGGDPSDPTPKTQGCANPLSPINPTNTCLQPH